MKIELPLQRKPYFRRPRRSQNDEKIVFLRSLLGVAGRDLPRGTSGRLQSGSRTENGRQEAPQGRPLGAVFGSFWGADSEVVFGSLFARHSHVTRTTRGGLGEAPGASNLRDLKDSIIICHASAPPLGGLRIEDA